ncbi:MAG TPA: substrate-binding domain-containing protein [Lacipirellulaceae bacterium]|jgi:DNA-binding LacI/PurR family transcriptional regulator
MPTQAKYTEVMSVIERRIREGDYLLNSIPGERKIAEETGVSYMTARRAVAALLDQKVLIRGPSGALDVHPGYTKKAKLAEVVMLYPAYPSAYLMQLRGLASDFAERHGIGLRPTQFVHWDEHTIVEAVEQARGAFIIPYGPEIPRRIADAFRANKVVVLDGDFAEQELPSIRLFSDGCIERVFDHLYRLGHRSIDCINTQNRNPEIDRRISIWEQWLERRGLEGQLWDDPAPVFTDPTVLAYRLMGRLVEKRNSDATAFVATTCPAAIGAVRACWERDIKVGKDLSICTVNIEPPAEFFCPSITGLNTPDLSDVFEKSVNWFFSDEEWDGPLLMEPTESSLFEGESTGKPIRSR